MSNASISPPPTVPGRSCDGCAMCCKLLDIDALEKPRGEWCPHCSTRQKCDIYLERPQTCRTFNCGYMTQAGLGDEWKPTTARMIVNFTGDGQHVFVLVDPARADAWKRAPYLQQMKNWARANNPRGQQVIVTIGNRYIVILPDREVDLGVVGADETVTFNIVQTPSGPMTDVRKVKIPQ